MSIDDIIYDNAAICRDNKYMIALRYAEEENNDYMRRAIVEEWNKDNYKVQYDRLRIYNP